MKTTKRKVIWFFILLWLSISIIGPVHAVWEDTEQVNSSLNDWVNSHTPQNKWLVTIKQETSINSKKEVTNYNLSDNKRNVDKAIDLLPSWMSQDSCINWKAWFIFFQSEIINCETFTVKWSWMNKFSKQFFKEIIEKKKAELLQKENTTLSVESLNWDNLDKEIEEAPLEESSTEDIDIFKELLSEEDTELNAAVDDEEDISEIFWSLALWLTDDVDWEDAWFEEMIKNVELLKESWNLLEGIGDESIEKIADIISEENIIEGTNNIEWTTSSWIVIWDISNSNKLSNQVDTVLEKFLNPDEYIKPVKIVEETIEPTIILEEDETVEEIEREVSIDELFPNVYINRDINEFTKSLFGPEVKNIMYGTQVNTDLISGISANYLAIALEKFRAEQEVLEIEGTQIFGLKWYDHYNEEIENMFQKFLNKNPSTEEITRLSKDLSAISFSFSTYTNRTINLKTKNVFKNKLILDFQALEKDYNWISKQTIIRNFLLKKAKIRRPIKNTYIINNS